MTGRVLLALQRLGIASGREVHALTGGARSTVEDALRRLRARGLAVQCPVPQRTRGRPTRRWRPTETGRCVAAGLLPGVRRPVLEGG